MHSLSFDSCFDIDDSRVIRTDGRNKVEVDGVYCGRSRFFKLAELIKLGEGAEAIVYDFPASISGLETDQVLKVFKRLSANKLFKLSELFDLHLNQPYLSRRLALPTDLLFDQNQSIAGYAMPKVELPNLREVFNALRAQKKPNYPKILEMFGQLSNFVETLHAQTDPQGQPWQLVIGDFNLANFLVTPDNNLFLIDTDGFGIRDMPVSMRGGVHKSDRQGQTVLQSSDYFQLYWNLIDILSPKGVQAAEHDEFFDDEIEKQKVSIFNPGAILDKRTEKFLKSLPREVFRDCRSVLLHGKRHPLKFTTLATLQEMYNPRPVVITSPPTKKSVPAKRKPAASAKTVTAPVRKSVSTPVLKATTAAVFAPVIDPKTKRAEGHTNLTELQAANYIRHFTSKDGNYFIFSVSPSKKNDRLAQDVYLGQVVSGEDYCYRQLSVKLDALYNSFEVLYENIESGYVSFRTYFDGELCFSTDYTYYYQTDLLLQDVAFTEPALDPEPKRGLFSRAISYLTTFDNNVATRSA